MTGGGTYQKDAARKAGENHEIASEIKAIQAALKQLIERIEKLESIYGLGEPLPFSLN